MEHTFNFHMTCLNKVCQACGERSMKSRKTNCYLCTKLKNDLLFCQRINIDKDSESKHSATMCSKCVLKMYSITSKLHMLERHCLSFIERWGFGLGLLGDQGSQMLLANIAKTEIRMVGIKDKSANLWAVVEGHRLQNAPSLKSLVTHRIKKNKNKIVLWCFIYIYIYIYIYIFIYTVNVNIF